MQIDVVDRPISVMSDSGLYITQLTLTQERGYISGMFTIQTTNFADFYNVKNKRVRNSIIIKSSKYGLDITRYFKKTPVSAGIGQIELVPVPYKVQSAYSGLATKVFCYNTLNDILQALRVHQKYIKMEGALQGIGVERTGATVYKYAKTYPYIFTNSGVIFIIHRLDLKKRELVYSDILKKEKRTTGISCLADDCRVPVFDDFVYLRDLLVVCHKNDTTVVS